MPQVDDQPDTALARALLERGALDLETLRGCLDEVRRVRERRPDVSLARLLLDRRLLAPEVIDAALGVAAALPVTALDATLRAASPPLPLPGFEAKPAGPTRIGDHEIERELARGGMGIVYVARSVRLDRRVALKVLRSGSAAEAEEIERFLIEGRAAARLRHPNLVSVHEVDRDGPTWFLAMDLIDGESLRARVLREGPLDPGLAARLTACVARALHEAHGKGVLHRDVKPHNVLLARDGTPFLTDFGLAKVVDAAAARGVTVSGQVMGTPAYMPPEQARGDSARVDRRGDVYSLGATLYELLTGRPPFEGNSPLNIIRAVVEDEPVPPSRRRPGVPPDLEAIVLKTLEKEPAARYDTAAELADDLDRFVRHEPTRARPLNLAGRIMRWAHRNPHVVRAALVTGALVLAGIVAGSVVQVRRAEALLEARRDRVHGARRGYEDAARELAAAPITSRLAPARQALERATTWLTLAPEDPAARRARYDAALALGHAERRAKRWSAAQTAFMAARGLGDDALVDRAIDWCRDVDEAMEAWAAARPGEALRQLDEAIARQPDWPEALRLRGRLRHSEFNPRARADLDRAIELNRDDAEALQLRAVVRLAADDRDGAAADARASLQLDPRNENAWCILILALEDARALEVCRQAVATFPRSSHVRELRGTLLLRVGDFAGALEEVTCALDLEPDRADLLLRRVEALTQLDETERAWLDLKRVRELAPEHPATPVLETELLARRGDSLAALERATEAIARAPGEARRWGVRGALRAHLGQYRDALDDGQVAVRLARDDARSWTVVALAYRMLGDPRSAADTATAAIELDLRMAHAWFSRGMARLELGDARGAADLHEFLRLAPDHAEAGAARARLASPRPR